jgi:hypothetical protein
MRQQVRRAARQCEEIGDGEEIGDVLQIITSMNDNFGDAKKLII